MCTVLSAQSIAATKVAIIVCNQAELKREILCAPGSDYDIGKKLCDKFRRKEQWNDIIERKAAAILEKISFPKKLHEIVISTVFLIGIRMLNWAEYHERYLSLQREYSVNFLNFSFFTQLGIINNKKAAEKLMIDEYLSIQQRYKLACLYCFTVHISELYTKMTSNEWEMFYNAQDPSRIDQPNIVKFWSYYLEGDIDNLKGNKNLEEYLLQVAVDSGSQAAVEYYLDRAEVRNNSNAILAAAKEVVKARRITDHYLIYSDERYSNTECLWVPMEYYADILYSLLVKMSDDQKKEFLKNDIRGQRIRHSVYDKRYRALDYFLSWPYKNYFIELSKLMIESSQGGYCAFPEEEYAIMLLKICDRIDTMYRRCPHEGEETCNYRELLKEFWNLSPERFKRYVFSDSKEFELKSAVDLVTQLLTLPYFTLADKEFIKLFLTSATSREKECIIFHKNFIFFYIEMIEEELWDILDRIDLNCFLSKEKIEIFKRELSFTEKARVAYIYFILFDQWDAVDNFIAWSSLSDQDVNKLKKEIIHSRDGRKACVEFIIGRKDVEAFERFVRWCFASEEEVKAFMNEFVFSSQDIFRCVTIFDKHQLNIFNEVIKSCNSSEEDIKRLKKNVAYEEGLKICEMLITGDPKKYIYIDSFTTGPLSKFEGGKWKEADEFVTWCFSSQEEISEFKKNLFFNVLGKKVHFNLIRSKRWEEAKHFFSWVGLSAEEIKVLKKETLFNYDAAGVMFKELMYIGGFKEYFDCGSEQEAIELFLKWFLRDKETVLEFKDEFKRWFYGELTEKRKAMFKKFDLAIAQCLSDFEKGELGANEERNLKFFPE